MGGYDDSTIPSGPEFLFPTSGPLEAGIPFYSLRPLFVLSGLRGLSETGSAKPSRGVPFGSMGEGRLSGNEPPANQRLTVPEAAAELGITEAAVRGRIKRGTLRSYRESGTVYVLLEGGASETNRDAPTDEPSDQSELIAVLREQLAAEREANRENRRLLAAALERIPAIESPETPGGPETASEESEKAETPADPAGAQEATERRAWWRRFFGIE